MTREEYEQKLDAALAAASKDKALSLDEWRQLYERYWKAVKKL